MEGHLGAFQLSLRAAIAAGLAVAGAVLLHLQHPVFALISAVLVTDLAPARTRSLAVPRFAGVALGTLLGASLAAWFPRGPWLPVLGVFSGMFLSHLLRLRGAARVAGYMCAIVVVNTGQDPWAHAVYRMFETLLGIAAALLVSLVPGLLRDHRGRDHG
jgi:uncharacterized membrane protein YgaE (UPF0421/DUF939 family)